MYERRISGSRQTNVHGRAERHMAIAKPRILAYKETGRANSPGKCML